MYKKPSRDKPKKHFRGFIRDWEIIETPGSGIGFQFFGRLSANAKNCWRAANKRFVCTGLIYNFDPDTGFIETHKFLYNLDGPASND